MAYTANLNPNQQLKLENQGIQTVIILTSSSPGQQQSQSSSVTTGVWKTLPNLFQTDSAFILQINTEQGQYFIEIQSNGIQTLATPPNLNQTTVVELQSIPDGVPVNPNRIKFEPMRTMQPMKMGEMSMTMNPMNMRMGNMSMSMGDELKSTSTKVFCTQCGHQVKASDRFCGSCGHQLDR